MLRPVCVSYEQLLPSTLYQVKKIKISQSSNVSCRMCNKAPESVAHVLSGCSALSQNKYLARHNNALKVLYFEPLRELNFWSKVFLHGIHQSSLNQNTSRRISKHYGTYQLMGRTMNCNLTESMQRSLVNHKIKEVVVLR